MFEVEATDFSLQASLTSGQSFRWQAHADFWCGVIGKAVVKVRQQEGTLSCETSDPAMGPLEVRRYFALDLDLGAILQSIDVDIQIHQAILSHRGLRVMRQDPWETLASFICASFNNIKRIEGMIGRLCQSYGEALSFNGFSSFSFPHPERLAGISERRLRDLGLGYRACYLRHTAKRVADRKLPLDQLQRVDYETVRSALLGCEGVGDKVADCVALFGFEKYEAFPIDVWMERAMRYYFRHRKIGSRQLHAYARRHFGSFAGYAQQYLYHDVRMRRGRDA